MYRLMYGAVVCVSKMLELTIQEVQYCVLCFTDLQHQEVVLIAVSGILARIKEMVVSKPAGTFFSP